MPVKFVELVSIDAKRFSKRGERIGQVRIDNNSTVTLVTEVSDKEANIDFRYTAGYGPIGTIKIEGRIIYEGDAPALAKQWSSKMNMPENVASEIHTAIMRTCMPEAVLIARDIHLPSPMPLPNVNIQKKKTGKTFGPEVA